MRSARSMTWGWRATLAILGLFIAVTWLLHFRLTDPRFLYCEDIAHYFLPTKAYTYQHPLEAFAGRPTPSTHFGSATFTLGGPAVVFPLLPALAARIAPQEPSSLMGFEWGITSLYVIASMTALFFFLSRAKVPTALAAAVACTYPWLYTIFIEWRHVDLLRGRLMLPLVLLGLFLATTKGGYAYWALLAAATVICMGQAFALYWVGALVCLWLAIHAWLERRTLLERLHGEGLLAIRRAGPPLLSLSLVSLALLPMYLRSRGAIEESAFLGQMASDPERLLDYLYRGHDWFTFADLLKPGRGLAPWSIAGISLLVAVMINGRRGRRQVIEGEVWAAPDELRPLRRIGGPLFLVSLALSFLPEVPFDLFAIRGDRLEWSFLPLAVTPSAAIFFHTTQRTWLVLAEIGGLLLGVGYLAEWTLRPSTPGRRRVEVAVAVGVYALLLFLAHALSRATLTIDVAVAVLVIAAVLAVATLAGQPGARPYLGSAALIVAGLLFSWRFADQSYQTGALHCSQGVKGGFNWSSQHLVMEVFRWELASVRVRFERCVARCGHLAGPRQRGARTGSGSGRRSLVGRPARTPQQRLGCRRLSGRDGSGKLVECDLSRWLRCRGVICRSPSVKRSPSFTLSMLGYVRSLAAWVVHRRRFRGSCAATRRLAAVP